MANRLADMHEIAPQLTEAVAKRITSTDLHDKALQDLGAFVHRTVVEDEHTYAVRIDDGAMLDAAEQIEHARAHLAADGQRQIAAILGCEPERLDARARHARRARQDAGRSSSASPARSATAPATAATRSCTTADRTSPPGSGSSTRRSCSTSSTSNSSATPTDAGPRGRLLRRRPLDDDELRDAAAEDEQRRAQARARHAEATRSNLGLGHDIRAGLIDPTRRPARRAQADRLPTCSSATTAS